MPTKCGGYSEEKAGSTDTSVGELFATPAVHAAISTHLGVPVEHVEVVAYKTQVVRAPWLRLRLCALAPWFRAAAACVASADGAGFARVGRER